MTFHAIDIHTHIVPAEFPAYAGKHGGAHWPNMQPAHDCHHKSVIIDGKNFRTVTDECWDIERRLEAMADMGIARQVLSPMPELLSYWLPLDDALPLTRHVNDTIAAMVARAPERFLGLGSIPMQDPDAAARELERLMKDGFRGVELGSNVNGAALGDPKFEPVFAAAEELGAAVFVHALHPSGKERIVGPPGLMTFIGFPLETAYTIASLITGGTLTRHPRLRLAFSHGGGAFASILPRLAHGWKIKPEFAARMGAAPHEHARRLYYDTLVYDAPTLKHLIDTFGVRQLCIGTDFPFEVYERRPIEAVSALGLSDGDVKLLHHDNAARFLGGD
ncbi:MAG TPA: amidohydrolase family protein [Pseudolabrys sp.]|jgi:aminocarboxymuconate-semialdehyde decarboxylase|nr:amidohydrolase family protein [Pseudolabrys sp.]